MNQSADEPRPQPTPQRRRRAGAIPAAGIDYGCFSTACIAGLCTAACPTYVETGNENDSPRGRIYLMRSVTDGRLELTHEVRRHLELCLDCRACETACPSGVQYGKLIEPFRVAMEQTGDGERKSNDWFHRWILFRLVPVSRADARGAGAGPHRRSGWGSIGWPRRWACCNLLPPRLRQLVRDAAAAGEVRAGAAGRSCRPIGPRRARVALFTGCVADAMFRPTQLGHGPRAAAKRLRRDRAAQARPAAGRFIFTPAAASRPASWPTRTWRRSTATTSTR